MNKKVLLLNSSYEVVSFINQKRALKLLYKEKVEIISNWSEKIKCGDLLLNYPATLRLKNPFKRNFYRVAFSRNALLKRDNYTCQYCSKKLPLSQITLDHVIPKAKGGKTSFTNCVVSCQICNNKKGDKFHYEVGLQLLKKPTLPSFSDYHYVNQPNDQWHEEWDSFLT